MATISWDSTNGYSATPGKSIASAYYLYEGAIAEDATCGICMDQLNATAGLDGSVTEDSQLVAHETKNGELHALHKGCIQQALSHLQSQGRKVQCPLCKETVDLTSLDSVKSWKNAMTKTFFTHAAQAALPGTVVALVKEVALPVYQWILPESWYALLESVVNVNVRVMPFVGLIPVLANKLKNSADRATCLGLVGLITSQMTDSVVPVVVSSVASGALAVYTRTYY